MKYLIFFLVVAPCLVHAELQSFVRDYTYNASENDSKVSARNAALQQLQTLIIQEVGVQVRSSYEMNDRITDDQLTRDVQAHYQTYAAALTQSVIVEEKWDGELFYLKAKVTVDTSQLGMTLQQLAGVPNNQCESKTDEVKILINKSHRSENVEALIALAVNNPIDEDCYLWQFDVLSQLTSLGVFNESYRSYLFERIAVEQRSFVGDLSYQVLQYALNTTELLTDKTLINESLANELTNETLIETSNRLTDKEWQAVLNAYQFAEGNQLHQLVRLLINHTQQQADANWNSARKDRNNRKLTSSELVSKLDQLLALNQQGVLGSALPTRQSRLVQTVLVNLMKHQPQLFVGYFERFMSSLELEEYQALASGIGQYLSDDYSNERVSAYQLYLEGLTREGAVNRSVSKSVYSVIYDLQREAHKPNNGRLLKILDELMFNNKEVMASVIGQARTQQKTKNLWSIRYQLPNSTACDVKTCAELLLNENQRTQLDAAEYLVAYGLQAKTVQQQVLNKLQRVKTLTRVQEPRDLTVALVSILDNIDADTDESYELLIWALGGLSKEVHQTAKIALSNAGSAALSVIKIQYFQVKPTVQRRLINVIATYSEGHQESILFLKGLSPENDHIRYAIDDALNALNQDLNTH